jgi:hypothetical protein
MMSNRAICSYSDIYWHKMKNNGNAVEKSVFAVLTRMIHN